MGLDGYHDGSSLPKTGTNGPIQLLFGLLLLAAAGLLWRRQGVVA
ncbi:MAG: LPXTG cell wall anchor domain-containing protein [Nitrospira sp.]|nr:MAG: LPXTG cell wall anchor domain-containing protein [Nitrospira sp.]